MLLRPGLSLEVILSMNSRRSTPYLLTGWLLASALFQDPRAAALPSRITRPTPQEELLKRGAVRELRALAGLGPKRAQALVKARTAEGGLPPLEEIPGIGALTAARVRASLGSRPKCAEPPSPNQRASHHH
jgi:transposase